MRTWFLIHMCKSLLKMPMLTFPEGLEVLLFFGLSLHLHPYFVYVSSDGYGESEHLCRLRYNNATSNLALYSHETSQDKLPEA